MSAPPSKIYTTEHWSRPLGPEVVNKGEVDAVVVGSGAGGAPAALTLARAGYRVLVIEKGPAYDQRDFQYDELRSCRRDFFVPATADEPHVRLHMSGQAERTTDGWTACCVGGATVHFSGFTYRLKPEDLKLRTLLGPVTGSTLADWPISWEELEPYFERAEYALGVSGDGGRNPFDKRRRPLPLPRLRDNAIGQLIEEASEKLGLHAFPTPRAILSQPWGGRSGCRVSYLCGSYGCASGAKSSTLAALLPKAIETGRCQVRPLSMVVRVEAKGDRAHAVHYLDDRGRRQRVRARVVVLACSAVETARLLLLSKESGHPDGLGNHSGQVGRNLMYLGFGSGECEFSRSDPRMRAIDWREPFVNRSIQDLYVIDRGKPSVRKGGTISFLFPHQNPIFTAEHLATFNRATPLWGKPLKDALRHQLRTRRLEFEIFAETLPTAASQVTLDPEIKDRFGLPAARFFVEQHAVDREICSILVDRGLEILRGMKGDKVRATRRGQQTYWLQGGTCRFGDDPKTSVLDRDCRCHSVRNLFVTDGSFMPTSGGVPNTLTIEANALRVGDRIVALGKQHAL